MLQRGDETPLNRIYPVVSLTKGDGYLQSIFVQLKSKKASTNW
jgi:hypothetical protein